MHATSGSFPKTSQLKRGAILGTIAHAIWLMQHPDWAHEQSWDGSNYSVQDSQGCRGTVTFTDDDEVVGVFRDEDSPRNPLGSAGAYDLNRFFKGIPPDLLSLAQSEALQYVLEEFEGTVQPIITAAFWSQDGALAAAEPWDDVVKHGAHILRIQFMEIEDAIEAWRNEYEFTAAQVTLLRALFERKAVKPDARLDVSEDEYEQLTSGGTDGLQESRELFESISIILPAKKTRSK